MTSSHIDYTARMHDALKTMVRDLLRETAVNGLMGDHHFYIAFETGYPGVELPSHLLERHPHEMTIVLQHQFWDLQVDENQMSVRLSFKGTPENIVIPFDAITGFMDPSVQFGLQLREKTETAPSTVAQDPVTPSKDDDASVPENEAPTKKEDAAESDEDKDNVITLDVFRNR